MEDVLHNVEGDDDIKALIGESLAVEILVDPLAYCGAERFVRVVIGTEIVRAFEPELERDAAPDRRTLMDTKAAPSWPRLGEDVGESALTRDGTAGAVAADVVVAEPRIAGLEGRRLFADRAPAFIELKKCHYCRGWKSPSFGAVPKLRRHGFAPSALCEVRRQFWSGRAFSKYRISTSADGILPVGSGSRQ